MIRFPATLPPACPALSVVIGTAERLPVRSPTLPFGYAGSLLAGPSASLSRSEPARNSDLSLARNDCPSPDHRYEVKAPGLLLSCHARLFREPFGRSLLRPLRFAPLRSGSLRYVPFSRSRLALPAASRISTPLQGFSPFRIKAFNPACCRKAHLPKSARWSFAPRSRTINSSAADHRSRLVTLPEAAVPQTSWNHFHDAPGSKRGQEDFPALCAVTLVPSFYLPLSRTPSGKGRARASTRRVNSRRLLVIPLQRRAACCAEISRSLAGCSRPTKSSEYERQLSRRVSSSLNSHATAAARVAMLCAGSMAAS